MCLTKRLPAVVINFAIAYTGDQYIGGLPKNNGIGRHAPASKPSATRQTSTQPYHPRKRK